jgi:multisubunit Na+/H+ antiporter MnhF subunit
MIITTAIQICEVLLSIAILIGFYRLFVGPRTVDRIIAFDLIVLTVVAFTALLSIEEETRHFVELILVVSLLGFFGTVAIILAVEAINREEEEEESS